MGLEELSDPLPWVLGAIAVIWMLRRVTRPLTPQDVVGREKHLSPKGEAGEEDTDEELALGEDELAEEAEGAEEDADEPLPLSSHGPLPGKGAALAGVVVAGAAIAVFTVLAPLLESEAERHCVYLGGMVLLLVASGFLRAGLSRFANERRRRAREQTAGAKWLRDRDWPRDVAQPIAEEGLVPQLLTIVFLGALVLPFHTIWAVDFSWWGFWVVIGLLDLLLFFVALLALRTLWFKIVGGAATLRWSAVPVAPGQTFNARLEVARVAAGEAPASITLRCMRDGSPGGSLSDDPAPDASPIWSETKTFPVKPLAAGGASIDLSFPVPPACKGTNTTISRPIRWQLVVKVPTAGPDFETIFAVPIYARE